MTLSKRQMFYCVLWPCCLMCFIETVRFFSKRAQDLYSIFEGLLRRAGEMHSLPALWELGLTLHHQDYVDIHLMSTPYLK